MGSCGHLAAARQVLWLDWNKSECVVLLYIFTPELAVSPCLLLWSRLRTTDWRKSMFQCSKANSDNEHPTLIILRRYYLNSKEGFQEGGLGGVLYCFVFWILCVHVLSICLHVWMCTLRVLGIEPVSSRCSGNALNCWAIFPAPLFLYFDCFLLGSLRCSWL